MRRCTEPLCCTYKDLILIILCLDHQCKPCGNHVMLLLTNNCCFHAKSECLKTAFECTFSTCNMLFGLAKALFLSFLFFLIGDEKELFNAVCYLVLPRCVVIRVNS